MTETALLEPHLTTQTRAHFGLPDPESERALDAEVRRIEADLQTLPPELRLKFSQDLQMARQMGDVTGLARISQEVGDLNTKQALSMAGGGALTLGALAELEALKSGQGLLHGGMLLDVKNLSDEAHFTPQLVNGLSGVARGPVQERGQYSGMMLEKK